MVENRREWEGRVFGWEGEGERKVVRPTSFLSSPFKIQSLQIWEKIGMKSGKNIWTKLLPTLLTFLAFFFFFNIYFFWLFLSLVTLAFCFCFLFLFSFFGFVRTWWVLLLFLFYFIIFLRKHFWMISYAIFWNIHFHLYTIFFKSIIYYFMFYLRGTWW